MSEPMELTGRTYIFAAATLVLLAGALKFYAEESGAPGGLGLVGGAMDQCRSGAVRTENVTLGCKRDLFAGVGNGQMIQRGSSKTITVGR